VQWFEKTNPRATWQSALREAAVWAIIGLVGGLALCTFTAPLATHWPVVVPVAVVFGAGVGALMEWQLDDGTEDFEECCREQGLCVHCEYDLRGTDHRRCPECGAAALAGDPE